MTNVIQVKRGANASLPTLNAGEFGFSTDTKQLYIGDGVANHEIFYQTDILSADQVGIEEIPTATYDDVQDIINTFSSGMITGGVISDSGSGQIDVSAGTGLIKTTDSAVGVTQSFNLSLTENITLTDVNVNYIYINYNAGSPVVAVTIDRTTIEQYRHFTLGRVYRSGTTLSIINSGTQITSHNRGTHERLIYRGVQHADGAVISETGTRNMESTAGVLYLGNNKLTTTTRDTSGTDLITRWYHSSGSWTTDTNAQIDNTYYDNGTDRTELAVNRYGVHWIFICGCGGDLKLVYGRGSYTLADAENASVPSSLPDCVDKLAILAAKVIIQKSDSSFTSVVSAYETLFPVSNPANHNDLGGIQGGAADDYYHLTNAQHGDIATKSGSETLTTKKYQLSDALGTDHTAEGTIINDTAGENLVFGDLVYQNSDGKWWKSDADATTTMPATAMAIATVAADAAGELLLQGTARDDSWSWAVGAEPGMIYASTTAGSMTQTAPSGTGDQVQVIATSITATIISFNPSSVLVEIGTGGGGGSSTASIYCSAESAYLPATNPAALVEASGATVYGGYSTLDFDTTTDEHAVWRVPVPEYDGGDMTFKFYWFGAATTGNVAWTIESIGVADAEGIVAAVVADLADVTADTVTGTTLDLNVTTHATYNPAGVAADDLMVIEITRDVSRDTMAGDAKLMGFLLEYERS